MLVGQHVSRSVGYTPCMLQKKGKFVQFRFYQVKSMHAHDPEQNWTNYVTESEVKKRFPVIAPILLAHDFVSLSYVIGPRQVEVSVGPVKGGE